MDLKSLQTQGNRDGNKRVSQANAQPNGTKPRPCTNPLAQLALNGPSKALDEYWRTCLREVSKEKRKEDQKGNSSFVEADWLELRQHIHQAYHVTEEAKPESVPQKNPRIEKVIKRLCAKDSQQLLLFLESQVQEFVIEVKVGLLELLNKTAPGVQLSRTFLTGLVEAYGRLCAGARRLAPPLKGVEEKHLSMFGMSWEDLNKLLFERCVHADPVMQLKVPQFIGHLHASLPAKDKSSFYGIFQRILALEDEMTVIAAKWKKVESFVHEKNVASLSSMVEELRLDPCGQGGDRAARSAAAAAAKEQCECRICTSPLLQQLSSMGLTSQNYKEVRERLRKMLDQKAQKTKAAASVAAPTPAPSKPAPSTGKAAPTKQATPPPTPATGTQKNQGKQKGSQQKTKGGAANNVPSNAKQSNNANTVKPVPATPPAPVQANRPGSAKTPAPFPAHVKQVPPPPPPPVVTPKQPNFVSGKQASCATQGGKHPTCSCAESKLARKANRHIPSASSSSSSTQPSTPVGDPRDIDALVDFIEGTDRGQARHKDEKKAAKKARQKLKKLQEREMEDEEEEEEEEEELPPPPPAAVVRVSRGSAAPSLPHAPRQAPPPTPQQSGTQARKGSPQMVTIRRVMEPSSSEPTVTITLKGATPEKDTVLFTLVNGQVCKDEENAQHPQQQQQQQQRTQTNGGGKAQQPAENKSKKKKKAEVKEAKSNQGKAAPPQQPHVTVTPIPRQPAPMAGTILEPTSYLPSGPSQLPRPSSNALLFTNQGGQGMGTFYAPATPRPTSAPVLTQQPQHSQNSGFTLDSIRLPPGITITKVEAHHQVQQLPGGAGVPSKEPPQEVRHYLPPNNPLPPSISLANMHMAGGMAGGMGMGGGMVLPNPNVIVVDTGKLIEDSKNSKHKNQQPKNGQEGKKGAGQKVQKSVDVGGQLQQQSNNLALQGAPRNFVTLKRVAQEHQGPASVLNSQPHTVSCEVDWQAGDGDASATAKKKKNKKKGKGKKVDEWNLVESVFAPKDIDLDAVDDDERELEAFKRFCFNSVPRERKEKVHLNIKDLVIRKKP